VPRSPVLRSSATAEGGEERGGVGKRASSVEQVGYDQSYAHGCKPHDPEMGIRSLLNFGHPFFHLIRKCEIGDPLYQEEQTEEAQEQSHDQPSPQ
jgi:hypothetical protein